MWPRRKCKDETYLGSILVQMEALSKDELLLILKELEQNKEKMIGEYLVHKNIISKAQLDLALLKQQMMRGKSDHKLVAQALSIAKAHKSKVTDSLDNLNKVMAEKRVAVKG